jgi:hypothetical protein
VNHVDISVLPGLTWRVIALEQSSEQAAGALYERLVSDYIGDPGSGNFSAWRTTTPDRSRWLVIVCGKAEHVDPLDLPGVPYQLTWGEAEAFASRRARVTMEAIEENPLRESYSQVAHYEQGGRIMPDGTVKEENVSKRRKPARAPRVWQPMERHLINPGYAEKSIQTAKEAAATFTATMREGS